MTLDEDDFEAAGADEQDEYVPVLYAEDLSEAERYCQLLEDHDIPAIVDEDYEEMDTPNSDLRQGVAVLAPEAFGEEAGILIEQFEDMNGLIDEDGELIDDDDYDDEDELAADDDLGMSGADLGDLDEDEPDV